MHGSLLWMSSAAALILPSLNAEARAFSFTRDPQAILIKNARGHIFDDEIVSRMLFMLTEETMQQHTVASA